MTRPVVPIANLNRRLPELGRIRTGTSRPGKKEGDKIPIAQDTFSFTSSDITALRQIQEHYGGRDPVPWDEPKAAPGQHLLATTAKEIHVALPPDPLGGTPVYELWGGGGCERRCDGTTCESWRKGPDGPEPFDQACICVAKGELACDPKTRLNVLLPNVRGIGTWRLETKSWNAAQELPGMVELIQSLQAKGITRATLRLEHKQSRQAGVVRKFIVPVLGLDETVEALVAGEASVGRLGAPPAAAIGAGVADGATVRGDATPEIPAAPSGEPPPPGPISLNTELSERKAVQPELVSDDDPWKANNPRARALADKAGWDDDAWHQAIHDITEGRTSSSKELTTGEWADLLVVLEAAVPASPDGVPSSGVAWKEWIAGRDGVSQGDVLRKAHELGGEPGTLAKLAEDAGLSARVMEALG